MILAINLKTLTLDALKGKDFLQPSLLQLQFAWSFFSGELLHKRQVASLSFKSETCSKPMKGDNDTTWGSGYCYLNKGECSLNQWKDDSLVEWVARNNSWNNGDRHKIHEISLINCFVFVIILVWKTVHSSATTQTEAHLMEKALQLTVPR